MRQTLEEGINEVLSSMVEDVGQVISRNMSGGRVLHELLNAPWLHALLKIHECLTRFRRLTPSPFLPYASGLSHEIIAALQQTHCPSAEAVELFSLLSSPHIQALLSSHDSVAQSDYGPVLPPLPDDLSEDEEAMRIVCLVKNNQPLSGEDRTVGGDSVGVSRSRWSSLRHLTLERLVPTRRVWSREEISASQNEATLLPIHRGGGGQFLPLYQSTGSCRFCPQSTELWKKGLNQSALSMCTPATHTEKHKPNEDEGASTGASSDDYAYPPPPVPAYTVSMPSSPVLYTKGVPAGHSRNIPTPGRTSSCPGMNLHRPPTASSSPATLCSTHQQGVSTFPSPERPHGCHTGLYNKRQEELLGHSSMRHPSTTPDRNGCRSLPKQQLQRRPPEFTKQCSVEELRSTVQTFASSIAHSSHDVRHLGQKMVAANEMITDSVQENAQALNLLAEVVDKLQGLIVAKKQEPSPPRRPKRSPPPPPPRISSISPKGVRKSPTPYPRRNLPSSSSSFSSSSSSCSSSSSSCADSFAMSQSPKPENGGHKRMAPSSGASQKAGGSGSNGQVGFNNGIVLRAGSQDQDCNNTGCLKSRRKKKKRKKNK